MSNSTENKPLTYGELLEQLKTFTPEQLAAPVIYTGDYHGGRIAKVWILGEEYLDFGDGMKRKSAYSAEDLDGLNPDMTYSKGTPLLEAE